MIHHRFCLVRIPLTKEGWKRTLLAPVYIAKDLAGLATDVYRACKGMPSRHALAPPPPMPYDPSRGPLLTGDQVREYLGLPQSPLNAVIVDPDTFELPKPKS